MKDVIRRLAASLAGDTKSLLLLLFAGAFLAAGWALSLRRAADVDQDMRRRLLSQVSAIAANINPELVKKLAFAPSDKGSPAFERIRGEMTAYGHYIHQRNIHSMAMRDGVIRFGPENLGEKDPQASPPGTKYENPPEETLALFRGGKPFVLGPYTDEYGTFVGGFAPVFDPATSKILMVVGMDILADEWESELRAAREPPLILSGVMALITAGIIFLGVRRDVSSSAAGRKVWITETAAVCAVGLMATAGAFLAIQDYERRDHRLAFESLAQNYSEKIRLSFRGLQDKLDCAAAAFGKERVCGRDNFAAAAAPLLKNSFVTAAAWIPRVPAADRESFERAASAEKITVWGGGEAPPGRDIYPALFMISGALSEKEPAGYDWGMVPQARAGIEEAIKSGMNVVTGMVDMPGAGVAGRHGVLMLHPLSEVPAFPRSTPEGPLWVSGEGAAAAAVSVQSLIETAVAAYETGEPLVNLFFSDADDSATLAKYPNAKSFSSADIQAARRFSSVLGAGGMRCVYPVFSGGHAFVVSCSAGEAFCSAHTTLAAWAACALGVISTGVAGVLFHFLSRRGAGLERTAARRGEELLERDRQLAKSEERYRNLFDSILDGVLVVSAGGGVVLDANPNAVLIFGLALSDLRGKKVFELFPEEARARFSSGFRRLPADRTYFLEAAALRASGSSFPAEVTCGGVFIYNGAPCRALVFRDVTERAKMREALAGSEENLRITLNSIGDAVIATDRGGCVTRMNPAAEFMTGWAQSAAAGQDINRVFNIINAKTRLPAFNPVRRVINTGSVLGLANHTALISRDGTERQIADSAAPIKGEDGVISGVVLVFRDVTGEYRIREALLANEERLNSVTSNIPGVVLRFKPDSARSVEFVSGGIKDLAGLDSAVLTAGNGRGFLELIHPDDRAAVLASDSALACGASYELEYRVLGPGGSVRRVHEKGRAAEAGGDGEDQSPRIDAVILDVTDKKLAEERLIEQMNLLRTMMDGLPDIVILQRPDHTVLSYNKRGRDFFKSPEPDQGVKCYQLAGNAGLCPDCATERTIRSGASECVERFVPERGLWVEARAIPVFDSAGKLSLIIEIIRDITARKKGEEEIRDANRRLAESNLRLEEAARRANDLTIHAEMASAAKSVFLSTISHEIRTPLGGVIGMTGLLAETPLNEEQREMVETIRSCGGALMLLINDVLDMSKIESGKIELDKTEFDLRSSLEEISASVAWQAGRKNIEVNCVCDPGLPFILKGDPLRLRQILLNLVGNALKFTDRGEISVTAVPLESAAGKITVRFTVMDTGIGIPPEKHKLLFKPFSQVDSSATRKFGGAGLGLCISKTLVELMGGQIWVESSGSGGSTFHFTAVFDQAPCPECAPLSGKYYKSVADTDPGDLRVLCVDDNDSALRLYTSVFAVWGIFHDLAASASSATAKLLAAAEARRPFDMILIDTGLPGGDTENLCAEIKSNPALKGMRSVAVCHSSRRDEIKDMASAGFSARLTKPVKRVSLIDCVSDVMLGHKIPPEVARMFGRKLQDTPKVLNLKILLVEDNPVNARIAASILKKAGCAVDTAADGAAALETLAKGKYDIVLMDCQMPVMDGFEATRRIRSSRDPAINPDIPIIALTANAMVEDRDRCINAGMNEYIPKPLRRETLFAVIEKVAGTPGSGEDAPEPADNTAAQAGRIPPPDFDFEAALSNVGGDKEFLRELTLNFINSFTDDFSRLSSSVKNADRFSSSFTARSISGAALIIGAKALAETAVGIEKLARRGDFDAAEKNLDILNRKFNSFTELSDNITSPGGAAT
jgi:PAS domain S-box-containing protein